MSLNLSGDYEDPNGDRRLPTTGQLRIQLSMLGDHVWASDTSYDDLFTEDAWKQRLFRCWPEPLNCVRHYSYLAHLQRLQRKMEESLKPHRSLEARVKGMKEAVQEAPKSAFDSIQEPKRRQLAEKCNATLRWLAEKERNPASPDEYRRMENDLNSAFQEAFKRRFTLA
uniref:Uncharacterized protein n=1 Tax=Macrostomum lignano TaxID=282301 RepID=A0A1I8I7Y3_9PLAT